MAQEKVVALISFATLSRNTIDESPKLSEESYEDNSNRRLYLKVWSGAERRR